MYTDKNPGRAPVDYEYDYSKYDRETMRNTRENSRSPGRGREYSQRQVSPPGRDETADIIAARVWRRIEESLPRKPDRSSRENGSIDPAYRDERLVVIVDSDPSSDSGESGRGRRRSSTQTELEDQLRAVEARLSAMEGQKQDQHSLANHASPIKNQVTVNFENSPRPQTTSYIVSGRNIDETTMSRNKKTGDCSRTNQNPRLASPFQTPPRLPRGSTQSAASNSPLQAALNMSPGGQRFGSCTARNHSPRSRCNSVPRKSNTHGYEQRLDSAIPSSPPLRVGFGGPWDGFATARMGEPQPVLAPEVGARGLEPRSAELQEQWQIQKDIIRTRIAMGNTEPVTATTRHDLNGHWYWFTFTPVVGGRNVMVDAGLRW